LYPTVQYFPKVCHHRLINMPSVRINLQLSHVPILDLRIWRIINPGNINPFHIMKQLPRFVPLIRPKLPRLSSRHHTNHPIPTIRPKFAQRLHAIYHKVRGLDCRLLPARVDRCALSVDRYEVFGADVPLRCRSCSGVGGGFE